MNLKIAGYMAKLVHDGEQAMVVIEAERFDLVLLDINLPNKDGLACLTELRKRGNRVPVIMVSARGDEYDKVAALRLGADDYVTKPFSLAELMARVDAVLRRTSNSGDAAQATAVSDEIGFGDVRIQVATRTVTHGDDEIKLTKLEFKLLLFLLRNPSRVFSRSELLRSVWGQNSGSVRTIDNFVAQLRGKLEVDAEKPRHFITVRGSGYRFDP